MELKRVRKGNSRAARSVRCCQLGRAGMTLLSVFTGAGGLDLGLELAGFNIVGCIEQDETARRTIQRNRPDWKFLSPHDIVELARVITPSRLGVKKGTL